MIVRTIFFLCAAVFLAGCSAKFANTDFPKSDIDIEIWIVQPEIAVAPLDGSSVETVTLTSGPIVGLLAASAQHHAMREAHEAFAPLREKLWEYSALERFADAIADSDIPSLLVSDPPAEIVREVLVEDRRIRRPVFRIYPTVAFSADLKTLIVSLSINELMPFKEGYRKKKGISQRYEFRWPVDIDGEEKMKRAQAAALWNARPTEELIKLIEIGIENTLDMARSHIDELELRFADLSTPYITPHTGFYRLWRDNDEILWLANSRGEGPIFAVPEDTSMRTCFRSNCDS